MFFEALESLCFKAGSNAEHEKHQRANKKTLFVPSEHWVRYAGRPRLRQEGLCDWAPDRSQDAADDHDQLVEWVCRRLSTGLNVSIS